MATRGYLVVFGVLLGLTVLTVAVSLLPMPATLAIAVGLAIAAAKGTLVAMFFMHLTHERMIVYVTLAFTAVARVVLLITADETVAGRRLSGDQMREVSASGCVELLIAPMTADELHDVIAIQLGEPRPGTEAFAVTVALGDKKVDATVSNLSLDGVRVVVLEPVDEGQPIDVTITPDGEDAIVIRGSAVWAQPRDAKTVVGVAFNELDAKAKTMLAKLTQWQVVKDGERTRVVLRGDFTEATRFDELLPAMVGRIVFDMAQVTYMNSLGVRAWCEFLRQARIQGYEFHACSVPFVLQASMVRDVIGRGTVTSFFAPFHCIGCDHQEERLLQSAAILASNLQPPVFKCPNCGGALEFDDLPERYFAFLQDDTE